LIWKISIDSKIIATAFPTRFPSGTGSRPLG
jgi:hypothetical protein